MRYVINRYEEYQQEMAYRIYVTDRLLRTSDNKYLPTEKRFYELIKKPEKEMSGDEIAAEVISRAGLVVKHESI